MSSGRGGGRRAVRPPATVARPLATPQFTSAVVVDSRTVTLSWTPFKGAHHYVVEYAPAMRVYTTETSVTITDLNPGDGHYFTVRAETRRNVPSGTSDPIIVPTPPEGPLSRSPAPYLRPTGPTRTPCNRSPSRTPRCGTWPKRPAPR
jgi:hypothetical protein